MREIYRIVASYKIDDRDYLISCNKYDETHQSDLASPEFNPVVCDLDSAGNRRYTWHPDGADEPVICDRLDVKSHWACVWIEMEIARGKLASRHFLLRIT